MLRGTKTGLAPRLTTDREECRMGTEMLPVLHHQTPHWRHATKCADDCEDYFPGEETFCGGGDRPNAKYTENMTEALAARITSLEEQVRYQLSVSDGKYAKGYNRGRDDERALGRTDYRMNEGVRV